MKAGFTGSGISASLFVVALMVFCFFTVPPNGEIPLHSTVH